MNNVMNFILFYHTITIALCPTAGYMKSRQALANFYSSPEAPLTAEVTHPTIEYRLKYACLHTLREKKLQS